MIEFKSPSKEDVEVMKQFANVIDSALGLLNNENVSNVAQHVAIKLQESLMWFSHGVLNKPFENPAVVDASKCVEPEAVAS